MIATIGEHISDYQDFLAAKLPTTIASGRDVSQHEVNPALFPFQRDIVRWSVRKGRAAIFADCGLGKTPMQLEWAHLTGQPTLIVAPLSVTQQTVREGVKFGIPVQYARDQSQVSSTIVITNYEMVDHFDAGAFGAVVLDESSILKSFEGKVRTQLIQTFRDTPYRLCCTATPAPNDIAEIANHAEFLGIMTRAEMLAAYFVHDDEGWRLKGHAREAFYRWLASWSMSLRKPSDLGYSDDGYELPALTISPIIIESEYRPEGQLFHTKLRGITDRSAVRRRTLTERVAAAASIINADSHQWVAWVGLNDEGTDLMELLGDDAILVEGSQSPSEKANAIERFVDGTVRVLVTKPSIAGFGLNMQNCSRMVFVGLNDSYEAYYQAIRRCWRFGQNDPVHVYIVLSDAEQEVYQNVLSKEKEALQMTAELTANVAEFEKAEIGIGHQGDGYEPMEPMRGPGVGSGVMVKAQSAGKAWHMYNGDSAEVLRGLPAASVDLSVFSPPFASLFTYSPSERDLGNSQSKAQFFQHFRYITTELLRVMKPGRNVCVHCQQLPLTKATDGVIGIHDFRGDLIRHFSDVGFTYHGEVCIDKDPQAQAIRTHSKGLLFVQLRKDAAWIRPAMADYILIFRAPGENTVPVEPDISNNEWIEWARPIWYGIKETNTLNVVEARENDDERHICPLQLGTIERCVRLWSNKGETVLSPFAGIGSEGYESVRLDRRFIGCELKGSYFDVAVKNLNKVESMSRTLFDLMEEAS